ncbi:hypothetical protein T484DRAFT_1831780 [Baffinella frigidus]|nr:hypothetical protein T484DRAFT_1831780 [Cryptophyta sp. CCMP2293]
MVCADFTRGAATLLSSVDDAGRYWYPVKDKREVAMFYSTCNPTCASLADEYHADVPSCDQGVCDGGMCKVLSSHRLSHLWR